MFLCEWQMPLNRYERFWVDCFGLEGRVVCNPYRSFCPHREVFLRFINRCHVSRIPCYLSVNPYRNRVAGLETIRGLIA